VLAVNPEAKAAPPKQAPSTETKDADEDNAPVSEEESWQKPAIAYMKHLWSGTTADYQAVWGVAPPADLVAFEAATQGANLYSTFHELRIDVQLMDNPPDDKNLFEMLVLGDQLNYLGTGLPEAFGAVTCFGTLGNGDTYHLEVYDSRGDGQPRPPRTVLFWDHDEHCFTYTFTDSLSCLAYLCALCNAADDQLVSERAAKAGYAKLRGRVAPSWHFSMDKRDPNFQEYKHPEKEEWVRYFYARAFWIIGLFRQDGIVEVKDLKEHFLPSLNTVVPAEHFPRRLEAVRKFAHTALYAMWRAYLFDEPELEQILEASRAHAGRLVRDSARLIDELRAGRNQLGKIRDWKRLLERFRALDLDPRRAAEREAEAKAKQEAEEARGQSVVAEVGQQGAKKLEELAWRGFADPLTRAAVTARALELGPKDACLEARKFLAEGGFMRKNEIYRDEEYQACSVIAEHADATLQALYLGALLSPAPRPKEEADDAPKNPEPLLSHAADILLLLARAGRLDERALPALREVLNVQTLEDHVEWRVNRVIDIVSALRDRGSVPALVALLEKMPSEGEFDVAMKYDDIIGKIARALRRIGDPAAAKALVRFAESHSDRMRHARTESAFAVGVLAPAEASPALLDGMLRVATKINGSQEDSIAILAYGLVGRARPAAEHKELREKLAATKPMASNYVEVQLAQAVAAKMLGDETAPTETILERALTKPGWKDEYTVRQLRWAAEVIALLPEVDPNRLVPLLEWRDETLTAEVLEVLAARKVPPPPLPRMLTWFAARKMSPEELARALADEKLGSRHQAARALAAFGEAGRAALEGAIEGIATRTPEGAERDLADSDSQLLRECARALLSLPPTPSTLALYNRLLLHPNRNLKGSVLNEAPNDPALTEGMKHVAAEKWAWQEKAARAWLKKNK
jgi:hypothetical protein